MKAVSSDAGHAHGETTRGAVDEAAEEQQQAEADAQTVHSALRGLSTDYTKIEHVLSGRTSEQLELLCREYQRRDPRQRQLHDDLRSSGSAMKARSKVTKLEQLLVRPKAHLDAIMVRSALQGRPEASRTFVPAEIVDALRKKRVLGAATVGGVELSLIHI